MASNLKSELCSGIIIVSKHVVRRPPIPRAVRIAVVRAAYEYHLKQSGIEQRNRYELTLRVTTSNPRDSIIHVEDDVIVLTRPDDLKKRSSRHRRW